MVSSPTKIERVFMDTHGVLLDFVTPAMRVHGLEDWQSKPPEGPLEEYLGITAEHFWHEVDAEGEPFWSSLPILPAGSMLLKRLAEQQLPVTIVSSVRDRPEARTGTRRAIWRHFGKPMVHAMEKGELASSTALLIDDQEYQVDAFVAAGGKAILYPQPWNRARKFWRDPAAYMRQWLGRMV